MSVVLIDVRRLLYLNKAIAGLGHFEDVLIPLIIAFIDTRIDSSLRMKEVSRRCRA